jgi:hypothetical protein
MLKLGTPGMLKRANQAERNLSLVVPPWLKETLAIMKGVVDFSRFRVSPFSDERIEMRGINRGFFCLFLSASSI